LNQQLQFVGKRDAAARVQLLSWGEDASPDEDDYESEFLFSIAFLLGEE
jgi:hypothetical protein